MSARTLLIVCASLACGVANAQDSTSSATNKAGDKDNCLRPVRMSGFSEIDNRHILVKAPNRANQFLVETKTNCSDLKWAKAVSIKSQSNMSCVDKFSKLYPVSSSPTDRPSIGCYVKSVERVESREAAKAIANARAVARKAAHQKTTDKTN